MEMGLGPQMEIGQRMEEHRLMELPDLGRKRKWSKAAKTEAKAAVTEAKATMMIEFSNTQAQS